MSMTGAQTTAFQAASGLQPAASNLFWLSVAITVATLWLAWVTISVYRGWATQNLTKDAAAGGLAKAVLMYCILTWLILH